MLSSDSAALAGEHGERVPHYEVARFDKGARAFALGCAVLYAVLSGGLVIAIVKATLGF